jgi:hypothetical protein
MKDIRINNKYKQAICRQLNTVGKEGKLNEEMVRLLKEMA